MKLRSIADIINGIEDEQPHSSPNISISKRINTHMNDFAPINLERLKRISGRLGNKKGTDEGISSNLLKIAIAEIGQEIV
ncbi:hypothetical protein KPH14_012987, partial [Odynerus spinipes]